MSRRAHPQWKNRSAAQLGPMTPKVRSRASVVPRKITRGSDCGRYGPGLPPEDWYEPSDLPGDQYRIVEQPAGEGYRHVLTPDEIRERLGKLPPPLLQALEVVQLSRMTRRKRTFPCYGMQWGNSVYLYPIEESLTEYFLRPPRPAELQEASMYGGEWEQEAPDLWVLRWTWDAIRDFYLNNVLIHELGHLVDTRNTRHLDRERYAEWFAIEYGYKPSRAELASRAARRVVRRHHHR